MIFYTLHNCAKFVIEKSTVGSFDKENKFKPCFKLNIFTTFYLFKLWYEWGISWGICQQYNCFTWLFLLLNPFCLFFFQNSLSLICKFILVIDPSITLLLRSCRDEPPVVSKVTSDAIISSLVVQPPPKIR